jgi:hypothetical protein
MSTLECEIVHVVSFPHLQEYYEKEIIPHHSFRSQNDNPQEIYRRLMKPN